MAEILFTGDIKLGPFVLNEEPTFRINSQFSALADGTTNKFFQAAGGVVRDITQGKASGSGQYKQLGIQLWEKTDPITVNLNITLYKKTDAFKDVVTPAMALMKLPLARTASGAGALGGLLPPGPSLLTAFSGGATAPGTPPKSGSDGNGTAGSNIYLRIGKANLGRVIVKGVEPTWSKQTDKSGHFIWCKLSVEVATVFSATQEDIEGMFK